MQGPQKPPSFPNLPKSALFSKLEAFLPVMAEENRKLDKAVAAGEGAKHNIEVEEDGEEKQDDVDGDDAMDSTEREKEDRVPVIEMNFALGMMDEDRNDSESEAADTEAQVKTPISNSKEEESLLQLRTEKPSNKPRPVIQELN